MTPVVKSKINMTPASRMRNTNVHKRSYTLFDIQFE